MMPVPDAAPPALLAALQYCHAGFPVLPLGPDGSPLTHEPTCDAEQLISRWAAHPRAEPAVVLGHPFSSRRLHLVALIDRGSRDASKYLAARGALDGLGLGHMTCGSERVWLFVSPHPLITRELAPGLEVIGDGLLPMPPSDTKVGPWRWRKGGFLPDRPLSAAPHWLRIAEAEQPDAEAGPAVGDDWTSELVKTKQGQIRAMLSNATMVLRCDREYAGRLAYDEMRLAVTHDGKPLDDAAVVCTREKIERRYGVSFGSEMARDALLAVGRERSFHPIRQYLTDLRWDGVARIDHVAADVLGAGDQPLAASFVRKWLISAAARALKPGCKVDTCLVLVGPQGALKSTFFSTLAGEWFSDTYLDPTNKDALQQIAAAWIYELGEIDSITSQRHASDIKRFMTAAVDNFRPPYERTVRPVPRTSVMVGSTNKDRFLTDDTGSRRFWIVRVNQRIAVSVLRRDQLWAEAVAALRAGEPWWLDDSQETARESEAEQHTEQDPWRQIVVEWFRHLYRRGRLRAEYTCSEVAIGALEILHRDLDKRTEMRMGAILRQLGLVRRCARIVRNGRTCSSTWAWWFDDQEYEWLREVEINA